MRSVAAPGPRLGSPHVIVVRHQYRSQEAVDGGLIIDHQNAEEDERGGAATQLRASGEKAKYSNCKHSVGIWSRITSCIDEWA